MWLKRISLLIIIVGVYVSVMVNYPTPGLKACGYQTVLDWYARITASRVGISILYDPGLRDLSGSLPGGNIAAVIPGGSEDYPALLDSIIKQGYRAVVECSALDAWHTSGIGQKYLEKMSSRTYRVVVFDGGHHLPTLGMAPDIIIIPATNGYAAHASMQDGMRTEVVTDLAREAGCPVVVASVSRWGLVKAGPSLRGITARIIAAANPAPIRERNFKPRASGRVSSCGGMAFAYVNDVYLKKQAALIEDLDQAGLSGVHKICLAFDYHYTDIASADDYCIRLSRRCHIPVVRVNEPVNVANAIISFGVGEDELPQPGYNIEND